MQLLVSVRSAGEAEAALEGGADVIDVKEPLRGSLGRADDAVLAQVVRTVAGRRIVTAAMGELVAGEAPGSLAGLTWIKWGLAGVVAAGLDWRSVLCNLQRATPKPGLVAVAYADAELAGSPPVEEVADFACENRLPVLLLDTWNKNGRTLLNWISFYRLREICEQCQDAGTRVALAGSLGLEHLDAVKDLGASLLAVRGAACAGGTRAGDVDVNRVRSLTRALVAQTGRVGLPEQETPVNR